MLAQLERNHVPLFLLPGFSDLSEEPVYDLVKRNKIARHKDCVGLARKNQPADARGRT